MEADVPENWEVRLIRAFDRVALKKAATDAKAKQLQQQSKSKSKTPAKRR